MNVRPARLALVGPTASGKSDLAHHLAQSFGDVEIVTVDSMQVYTGMDIGTAKPTADRRSEVPHHLLDIADPAEDFALGAYQRAARAAVDEIETRGRRPMLVGGTGLYLRAIIDELDIPGRWPDIRGELEAEDDVSALHARLQRLDPVAAGRMDPGNRRRVVRALEVCLGSGRAFSSYGDGLERYVDTSWNLVGLDVDRAMLRKRIADRLDAQLDAGFLDEVRRLTTGGHRLGRTAAQALGYRQLADHLAGQIGLAEAVEATVTATRRFARRQRSWFNRDPRLTWMPMSTPDEQSATREALLSRWG